MEGTASEEHNDNDNMNFQMKEIVQPNCIELDWAQIFYAFNYKRLLFINCYQTWSSFHNENDNVYKYGDYTSEDLSDRFLQRVLPNIFEYELTENELYLASLFDFHPKFSIETAVNTIMQSTKISSQSSFICSEILLNKQIVTVGQKKENLIGGKFNFNSENAALLSVALCSNDELLNCGLLSTEEILKRLKDAKYQFESSGRQPEHLKISLSDLVKKLEMLSKLRDAVRKLLNNSFSH